MDRSHVPTGNAPTNSLAASATTITSGQTVTLTPSSSGASYSYIDKVGFVRGAVKVSPTTTTTYTLYSNNAYGTTASRPVTITVSGSTGDGTPKLVFASIPTQTVGKTLTVSATSNSPAAITFSSLTPNLASVSGKAVTFTKPGTAQLAAHQAASGSFKDAYVLTSFAVAGESPDLTLTVAQQTYPGTVVLRAATASYGAITYQVVSGPAKLSGSDLTLTGTGEVTVTANEAAVGKFASGTATASFKVVAK